MPKRATISVKISVDLDSVPGRFHAPKDFSDLMLDELKRVRHYKPELEEVTYRIHGEEEAS